MTRHIPFTKAQVRRAVQAAESTGKPVRGFRVTQDGTIVVEFGEIQPLAVDGPRKALAASWDDA